MAAAARKLYARRSAAIVKLKEELFILTFGKIDGELKSEEFPSIGHSNFFTKTQYHFQ